MPRIKLTEAAVRALKPPANGQIDYFDAAYPGLCLRISAQGVRSWTYFGRVHGKLKRATLGRYPDLRLHDARIKAGQTSDAMRLGIDPAEAKRAARAEPDRDLVAALVQEWLKRDQGKNRSKHEVERILMRDVLPLWSERKIQSVTRRDVIELIDGVVDRGAVTLARRLCAHLHRFFRWCVGRGVLEVNPASDIPKPGSIVSRDRVLKDSEIVSVWKAATDTPFPFGPLLKLLVLTAARRHEIGALQWSEVDIPGAVITLSPARNKNATSRIIPLSPQAVAELESVPRVAGSAFVFTTTGETSVSGWSRAKAVLDKKIAEAGEPLADWRLHDIRRSVATGLQRLGHKLECIEAVLGHVSGTRAGIVGVYQRHSFADEARSALEDWGRHVEAVTTGAVAPVIPMSRRRR